MYVASFDESVMKVGDGIRGVISACGLVYGIKKYKFVVIMTFF